MKDNQAKYPQLRFKGFTDPWEQHKLGEVVEMFNGDRGINYPKNNDLVPEGVPFINAGDLQNGQVNLESCKKISKEKFNQLSGAKIRRGDILYCLRGTIGKNALVEFDEGTVASSLVDIRPKNIDRMYLFIILNSNIEYRQRLLNDEGAAQPNLSVRNLSKFYIPVPQTKEQHKISVFFKSFNELLTLHQRKLAKLKELKQGYLQKLFPKNGSKFPQLRFAGFADAWEQRKASNIFQIITDYVANGSFAALRKNVSYSEKKDFAIVVRLTDYSNGYNGPFLYTSEAGYKFLKKSSLVPGDILISNVGANAGLVYRTPNINVPMTLGPNSILVRTQTEDTEFLYQMMHSINGVHKIKMQIGISAQPKFNKTEFRQIEFSLPGKREQEKIGIVLNYFDQLIASNQRKLEKLQELKKGYLQKMFC